MTTPFRLPMFPLGSVLFPGMVLPLQVFEPRYVRMLADLVDGDGRFGVVLIERGSEVGGGDERFGIGTVARVVRVAKLDEARLGVVAVGEERIRIAEWLPDDPYPQAMVEPVPDDAPSSAQIDVARVAFRRTLALASELGYDVAAVEDDMPDEPVAAAWYLCAAAPVEEIDRLRLLAESHAEARLGLLATLLDDRAELLRARLGGG